MSFEDYYIPFPLMSQLLLDRLSGHLNITKKELEMIEPELCPVLDYSGILAAYTLFFKESASEKILSKIEGLENNNSVTLYLSGTPVVKMQPGRALSRHNSKVKAS